VARMSVTGGFLLLVGEPVAGKTRCAFEAIRGLPLGWRMYVRSGSLALQELIDARVPLTRTVIWLDDIHQLLDSDISDADHLTAATVRRLLLPGTGPVIIMATTWTDRRDRYSEPALSKVPDLLADARAVINMAQQFDLNAAFSGNEWSRAASMATADPRLAEGVAAGSSKALAATLANRDELIRRWRYNSRPVSAATISASIDARRCGHPEPIPAAVIGSLVPYYLTPNQRTTVSSGWLEQALADACTPVRGDPGHAAHRRSDGAGRRVPDFGHSSSICENL
jgi:hypothetical protein